MIILFIVFQKILSKNSDTVVFNPHMHEIFLQRYCMKWVPGDQLREMIN